MSVLPRDDVRDRLRGIVAGVLEMEEADVPDEALLCEDLGADSLEKVEIAARVEHAFGIRLTDEQASRLISVSEGTAVLAEAAALRAARGPGATPAQSGDTASEAGAEAGAARAAQAARAARQDPDAAAQGAGSGLPAAGGIDLVHRLVGRQIARGRATATAYLDPDLGTVSYGRLYEAARACASDLRALGAADGERVLVVAEDSAATVSAVLGLWWAGAVPVMASPLSTPSELEFTAADCEARFVYLDTAPVRQRELEERFSALARYTGNQVRTLMSTLADRGAPHYAARPEPRTAPADAPALRPPYAEALVQYTSGSSGKPKGVRHSAAGIIAMLDGFGPVPGLREDDVVLSTARMSFGFGFGSSVLCSLDAGAATALIRGAVDAHVVGAAVRRYRPTVLYSVPRMYAALLDGARAEERDGLTRLRLCVSAGERCPEALAERIVDSLQVDLMICLGATELMHVVLATHPGRPAPGSVGYPVPGTNVTARDDHGRLVPDGTPGRLHVAGPTVALGYIHRPAEQAATFADGGAYTNDLVVRRSDGEFEYLCRTDDVLNLGGYKVAPVEIETVVRAVRGVADCRVVAAVDRDGLEHAVVYAVAAPGAARETVRRAVLTQVRTGLAGHKRPSRVEFLDALPLSANGKVAVHQLRAREART